MKFLGFNISVKRIKRHYEAADRGRRTKSFKDAMSSGVNKEISRALPDIRNRSRHMVRNNAWAKRAVEAVVKHTVGEGIRPAPVASLVMNKRIKDIWRAWAETTACDYYGRTTFYGLQELAMRAIVEGGDIIVVLRHIIPGDENELPIKIQLCEGDFIDHTRNGVNNKGIARLGVQYSLEGELLGYWLFEHHPGDGENFRLNYNSDFVSKVDVLHVFELLRIGQTRGLPFGVASFMRMMDFSDYEDAQLVKQKIASCFTAFITGQESITGEEEKYDTLEPGVIDRIPQGETVTFSDPPVVGDFSEYTTRILQGIAAAYGITYEMLTMDYSRVNFTSGRMAKIDVTGNFRSWQYNMMVPQFCAPVWEWFIDACLITGQLPERVSADWTAPRVQQLDPTKETTDQVDRIKSGLATLSETIREDGRDPEEFFKEYAQDVELLKKLGLTLDSVNGQTANNAGTSPEAKNGSEGTKSPDGATSAAVKEKEKKETSKPDTQKPKEDKEDEEVSRETTDAEAGDSLAAKFGVGITQSVVAIISDEKMTDIQKLNILVVWIGMDKEQAEKLLSNGED